MLPRRLQTARRSSARPSLLGDGLLERIRSTSLALLGLTTVVGLGLIAFTLQLGWSVAPSLPIPGVPGKERGAVSERTVAAEPDLAALDAERRDAPQERRPSGSTDTRSAPADSQLASAEQVGAPVAESVNPAAGPPSGEDETPSSSPKPPQVVPAPTATTAAPVASPPPVASSPAPPVTATVDVPAKDDSRVTGRSRSTGKSSWKAKGDKDRWSDDSEYEAPLPAPKKDDVPTESTAPPPAEYEDDSDDDEGGSSDWDGRRGHGQGHRR